MRYSSVLFVATLLPIGAYAMDWPTHKCPDDEAACYVLENKESWAPSEEELKKGRVVFAFGTDGCMASSPIYSDKDENMLMANPGIGLGGARNGHCGYSNQLNKSYLTYREVETVDKKYKARIFGLYAVKDQTGAGGTKISKWGGHRHEWEHVILWFEGDEPKYMTVTQHRGVKHKKINEVSHLPDDPKAFAVKYIVGSGFWATVVRAETHYPDFADGKNNIVKNNDPTPDKRWFGTKEINFVDYDKASCKFQQLINTEGNWGDTKPRINDVDFINSHLPDKSWNGVEFSEFKTNCSQ